jgi:hypothetical protein
MAAGVASVSQRRGLGNAQAGRSANRSRAFGAAESQDSHPSGRACSGVILISISKEPLRLLLAVPADDSTVAFMRLKRAVDAVDETLPDSGRVEQILPNVAERKRRLKEQVHIRDVDGQITSECPRVHRPLVQINGDLFPVYVH